MVVHVNSNVRNAIFLVPSFHTTSPCRSSDNRRRERDRKKEEEKRKKNNNSRETKERTANKKKARTKSGKEKRFYRNSFFFVLLFRIHCCTRFVSTLDQIPVRYESVIDPFLYLRAFVPDHLQLSQFTTSFVSDHNIATRLYMWNVLQCDRLRRAKQKIQNERCCKCFIESKQFGWSFLIRSFVARSIQSNDSKTS